MDNPLLAASESPFHAGEQALQERTGKRDVMETFGRQAIRSYMPEQHREFFAQLPFVLVGSVDSEGWPWASMLTGKPGFLHSPDPQSLTIDTHHDPRDPLSASLVQGNALGLLGIELPTRRRNRVNVTVGNASASGITLAVEQSFGNCPQYIQKRYVEWIREPDMSATTTPAQLLTELDSTTQAMIEAADTFFVSSYLPVTDQPRLQGVDVSHRGGKPGFVKVEGNTLTVPDYAGNYHFNTLGNFLLNPKAGLIFTDFETGDVLQLTGTVELIDDDHELIHAFKGAERGWRFTLDHGQLIKDALPFRSTLEEYSANSLITGDWQQASATAAAELKRNTWQPYRVTRIENESAIIQSIYLEPANDDGLPEFKAGQFLTIRVTPEADTKPVVRTYTVSSAPGESYYRLSVKREQDGRVSQFLHRSLKIGDQIEALAPRGEFSIDASELRPAVLIAGGVGITPMVSMANHVANEGLRTRGYRQLTIFHAAQSVEQRAFFEELGQLNKLSQGSIRYLSFVDQISPDAKAGVDYHGTGYLTADVFRQALPLDDYDIFLCGPPAFMQAIYDVLRSLGVQDSRIKAEAFGPASLQRSTDIDMVSEPATEEAGDSLITFVKSGFEQRWSSGDGTLLEVAEAHGLTPEYGCRAGGCGSCAVKLKSGSVAYRTEPTAQYAPDEVLICCAVPAKGSDIVKLEL